MHPENDLQAFIREGYLHFLPHVSLDCVVFGFHDNQLKVLLVKWKKLGGWSLPGGRIKRTEHMDDAAQRTLEERTGIREIFLQQFHTFGRTDRTQNAPLGDVADLFGEPIGPDNWLADRTVSVGYYALVEFSKVNPTPDFFSEACRWWDLHELPPLLFDHNQMVTQALHALRAQLHYQPIGYTLLPETFTMPELQALYETILDRPLDRRNFQKRMLGLGYLQRLDERRTIGAHKSPYLYRFDRFQYEKALQEGLGFGQYVPMTSFAG
ncbi:NUDIX domain-containing protein [Catalinimonas alkaloidigena]|uniref:NUDIX domain-containing protein n=1 Tax=Catalinimonas alkaloidigena TaxID=1075417 RepID=A0A1G9BL45_9BACT|nr:NUDIX domain-containing protein [Catalinimonas alkaloidigena]SDK40196.1 NUDIX domain-containing protein [Catalinimonas alkaloidigena]